LRNIYYITLIFQSEPISHNFSKTLAIHNKYIFKTVAYNMQNILNNSGYK